MPDSILEKYLPEDSPIRDWPMNSFKYRLLKMVVEESVKGTAEAKEVILELSTVLTKTIFVLSNDNVDIALQGVDAITEDMKIKMKHLGQVMKKPESWMIPLPCLETVGSLGLLTEKGTVDEDKLIEHIKGCKLCADYSAKLKAEKLQGEGNA